MSAPEASAAAFDAAVETVDNAPGRTPAQQAYLDQLADEAENAVTVVENMIAEMTASLDDRKAHAKQARDEADRGRIQ